MQNYLLTILILLPVIGAATRLCMASRRAPANRITVDCFGLHHRGVCGLVILVIGSGAPTAFRFEENYSWIGAINARYHLGVDGISLCW
jgi:NADH:ubiquinone oxidoreductase subunit 4 (subunit M)